VRLCVCKQQEAGAGPAVGGRWDGGDRKATHKHTLFMREVLRYEED
jgi:hypothetical protein